MIEVELKARLRDRAAAEAAVAAFARPAGRVEKRDAYWHGPDWRLSRGTKGFRVRSEGLDAEGRAATVVTFKTKRSEGGIEINHEREFSVSDAEATALPLVTTDVGNYLEYDSAVVIPWRERDHLDHVCDAIETALGRPRGPSFFEGWTLDRWRAAWRELITEVADSPPRPPPLDS